MVELHRLDNKAEANNKLSFRIQEEVISDSSLLGPCLNEGARLVFIGLVRDYNHLHSEVCSIEYHCYQEMAEQEGMQILQQALDKFAIRRAVCIHRIGLLQLQDTAIRLEIGSSHRLPALRACEYIMNQIKLQLPIWKKEFYLNGIRTAEWT